MITLQVASETLEFKHKIGEFSQPMKLVIKQICGVDEEPKFGKPKLEQEVSPIAKHAIGPSENQDDTIEDNNDDYRSEEICNGTSLGLVSYVKENLKWLKKVFTINFLSFALHGSLLVLFREISIRTNRRQYKN